MKRPYVGYFTIAVLYVLIKVGYVSAGYLHSGAIVHGLIPGVLTAIAGRYALRAGRAGRSQVPALRWMVILPLLTLVLTPPYMFWKQGAAWLSDGRLSVLVIYEGLAAIQLSIAIARRVRP